MLIMCLIFLAAAAGVIVLIALDCAKKLPLTAPPGVLAAVLLFSALLPGYLLLLGQKAIPLGWEILPSAAAACLLGLLCLYIIIKSNIRPRPRRTDETDKIPRRLRSSRRLLVYALFSGALWFLILGICGALACRAAEEPVTLSGILSGIFALLTSPLSTGYLMIISPFFLIVGLPVFIFAWIPFVLSLIFIGYMAVLGVSAFAFALNGVCRAAAEPRLRKWLALFILAQLIPLLNLAAMLLLLILESVMLRKTAQPGAASAA